MVATAQGYENRPHHHNRKEPTSRRDWTTDVKENIAEKYRHTAPSYFSLFFRYFSCWLNRRHRFRHLATYVHHKLRKYFTAPSRDTKKEEKSHAAGGPDEQHFLPFGFVGY